MARRAARAWGTGFKLAACLAALGSGTAVAAHAATATDPTNQVRVLEGEATSFTLLAAEIAKIDVGEPGLVVVAGVEVAPNSPIQATSLEALRQKLRDSVAGAIPLTRVREPAALSVAEARTKARRLSVPLVYLQPALSSGRLQIQVSVVKWPRSFWQRALSPEGATTARLKVAVQADSLIRSHFPQPKKLLTRSVSYKTTLRAPLDIACGDLDGDGSDEIAILNRETVTIGHIAKGTFLLQKQHQWSELSPVAAAPLRAPLGGLSIHGGRLRAGISDRALFVEFDEHLNLTGVGQRRHPWSNGRCSTYTASGISLAQEACPPIKNPSSNTIQEDTPRDVTESADAAVAEQFTSPEGLAVSLRGHIQTGSSRATLFMVSPTEQQIQVDIEGIGAVLHAADLDGDGDPEIISSRAVDDPTADGLRVHALEKARAVEVASLNGGPVHALTTCSFSGANPLTIVAAVGDELWVIE